MPRLSHMDESRRTVLIIDDDDMVLDLAGMYLNQLGYGVLTATGGLVGLGDAVKFRPDCILLDLAMPKVDGFTVLAKRGRIAEIARIPIIVLSANRNSEDVKRAVAMGAAGYIAKPIDINILANRLERIVPSPYFTRPKSSEIRWKR